MGDKGELRVGKYLENAGFSQIKHVEELIAAGETYDDGTEIKREEFDIRAIHPDGYFYYIEVKNQDECHRWKYVNVEQVQNGVAAGIAVSKADEYIFVNDELGIGVVGSKVLKTIHRNLCIDTSVKKESYVNKENVQGVQLWITEYKNWACGFKFPIAGIKWEI